MQTDPTRGDSSLSDEFFTNASAGQMLIAQRLHQFTIRPELAAVLVPKLEEWRDYLGSNDEYEPDEQREWRDGVQRLIELVRAGDPIDLVEPMVTRGGEPITHPAGRIIYGYGSCLMKFEEVEDEIAALLVVYSEGYLDTEGLSAAA